MNISLILLIAAVIIVYKISEPNEHYSVTEEKPKRFTYDEFMATEKEKVE